MAMGKTEGSQQHGKSKKKEKDNLPTKVVVRRLPPSITEEALKDELDGMPDYDYLQLVAPDYSLAPNVFSRAYINFKSFKNVLTFRNSYDGYIFNDGKGNEYSAVVELAPFQGIPKEVKKRKDPKCGTILKDPDYEAFLENLSKKVEPLPSAEVYLEVMESIKADKGSADKVQTPLVEYLNKKRALRNQSRQNTLAMLENERKLKREKENLKDITKSSKADPKSSSKDIRKERTDSSKASQDRKINESKRKEERKDRKSASGRKSKQESESRAVKETRKDFRKDKEDRPMSGRSDSSKHTEERYSKRDDRRQKDDRRDKERRKYNYEKVESISMVEDQKKKARTALVKEEEKHARRKSIEFEDPSIVAFVKTSLSTNNGSNSHDGKAERKVEDRKESDSSKGREKFRDQRDQVESERRTKNRDRPSMAVYRPPSSQLSERQDRGKNRDERVNSDKYRVKSPENSRSPEKRDRISDRGSTRDRPRSRPKDVNTEKEANLDKESRFDDRETDRKKEKESKSKDKDLKKDK